MRKRAICELNRNTAKNIYNGYYNKRTIQTNGEKEEINHILYTLKPLYPNLNFDVFY